MKDRKILTNRNLDDHLGTKFEVPSEEGKWEGQEMQVNSEPLEDNGTGKKYLLRFFDFKINPDYRGQWIDKQSLFNAHAQQIKVFLWRDGLIPNEDVPPRILLNKKKGTYQIVVLCQPYSNHGVRVELSGQATPIQDIIKNAQQPSRRNRK